MSSSRRSLARAAARTAALELALVSGFQVAVAAGAPWGAWTQGGTAVAVLPPRGRLAAGVSTALLLTWAGALLARTGEGPMRAALPRLVTGLAYSAAGYGVLGTAINAVSRSPHERALWTPASAALAALSLIAIRGSR